ncbi:MAG TPA: hypothetical protein VH853_03605, partial [Polyangia bacterium]|nr:hypothetical protein [Polyangia bacterium]
FSHSARSVGIVSGQRLRHPLFVAGDMLFDTFSRSCRVGRLEPAGAMKWIDVGTNIITVASCGTDLVASVLLNGKLAGVRLDRAGHVSSMLDGGAEINSPVCSTDGRALFYVERSRGFEIRRCELGKCKTLVATQGAALALSPDGTRLAFIELGNRGLFVRWINADGSGGVHDVMGLDAECEPGWSSNKDLWVPLRQGKRIVWTEIDADTGRPTGRTSPGSRDCSNGSQDPLSPVTHDVQLQMSYRSEVRLLSSKYLPVRQ